MRSLKQPGENVPFWRSNRLRIAVLLLFGSFNVYALTYNLNVSLVCMLNNTASESNVTSILCAHQRSYYSTQKLYEGKIKWDSETQNHVIDAFVWPYMILQIPCGLLVTKYGCRVIYGCSMMLASLIIFPLPVLSTISSSYTLVIRGGLGLLFASYGACTHYTLGRWAPPNERSKLTSISYAGRDLGMIAVLIGAGFLCGHGFGGGWPSTFYLCGIFAFIWSVVWLLFMSNTPTKARRISHIERKYITDAINAIFKSKQIKKLHIPWRGVFTSLPVYAVIVAQFTSNWAVFFLTSYLPKYVNDFFKLEFKKTMLISSIPFVAHGAVALTSGWLADFVVVKHLNTNTTRLLFNTLASFVPALFFIVLGFIHCDSPILIFSLLTVSFALRGMRYSGHVATAVDISPRYSGFIYSIAMAAGALGGKLAVIMDSNVTKIFSEGNWNISFFVTAAVEIFGAVFFILCGSAELQDWDHMRLENSSSTRSSNSEVADEQGISRRSSVRSLVYSSSVDLSSRVSVVTLADSLYTPLPSPDTTEEVPVFSSSGSISEVELVQKNPLQ